MNIQGFARRILLASLLVVVVFAAINTGLASATTLALGYLTQEGHPETYTSVYLYSGSSGNYVSGIKNPDKEKYGPSDTIDEWTGTYTDAYMSVNYDIHIDNDPQVTSFFALLNPNNFTNTFTFTVSQPVSPTISTSLGSGSTGYTLTAAAPNATLDSAPLSALYNAQINGVTVKTLFPVGSGSLPVITSTSATISDSFSGQPEGSASSIGIFSNFTLSAGDLVSSTNIFKIDGTVAPEPASITLSLLGLLGMPLAYRLRRR